MKAYYAHCMAIYGTPQEDRDVETLENAGFTVVNPNNADIEEQCHKLRDDCRNLTGVDVSSIVMNQIFKPLATNCDLFAFRALPDGRISAGVAKELEWAREAGIPVLELPSRVTGRTISVEETREYLKEIGQR